MSRVFLILCIVLLGCASAFLGPFPQTRQNRLNGIIGNEDFPPEEESSDYTGSVDWDAEWKKVVASEGKLSGGSERPGKEFYKSEAEIAAIKATNKAAAEVAKAGAGVANVMPDIRSLSGDWKFWIAILAIISVGLSLLSAPPADMAPGNDGSFYI